MHRDSRAATILQAWLAKRLSECPGELLTTTGSVGDDHALRYRASCDAFPLKPQCCPNMPSRKVTRDA
jgi:hypothetical protein